MLTVEMKEILTQARPDGWVLEPAAKKLLAAAGLPVPRFTTARSWSQAKTAAAEIGFPLVAKVVSADIIHKTDCGGVIIDIQDEPALEKAWNHLHTLEGFRCVLLEEMLAGGIELFAGAKHDPQFGPIVLLGIGGTGVELYGDVAVRMAPITTSEVGAMVASLTARRLIEGYRGQSGVDLPTLAEIMARFSEWVMALERKFESIDLNPLLCNGKDCRIADARIILPAKTAV